MSASATGASAAAWRLGLRTGVPAIVADSAGPATSIATLGVSVKAGWSIDAAASGDGIATSSGIVGVIEAAVGSASVGSIGAGLVAERFEDPVPFRPSERTILATFRGGRWTIIGRAARSQSGRGGVSAITGTAGAGRS